MIRLLKGHDRVCLSCLLLAILLLLRARIAFAHWPHDIIEALELSPSYGEDQTVFVALAAEGLFKSTDGGRNWKHLAMGLDNRHPVSSIAISPDYRTDETLFVATIGDGIYRSQDGGASWASVNSGLHHLGISLLSISPDFRRDRSVVAAGTDGALYATRSWGDNWYRVREEAAAIAGMAFCPNEEDTLLIGDQSGRLYASSDVGEHWRLVHEFSEAGSVTAISVSPSDASRAALFVGTQKAGIFKSVDQGSSFRPVNKGVSDRSIVSLAVSPRYATDHTIFASTWHKAVFRSTDGGESWQLHSRGLTTDRQADDSLFRSPQFRYLRASSAVGEDGTLFLAGFDGLFRSTDRGLTWVEVQTTSAEMVFALGVSPEDQGAHTLAAATYGAGVYSLDTRDRSWTVNNRGLVDVSATSVVFSPDYPSDDTMFLSFETAVMTSSDRGEHWQNARIPRYEARVQVTDKGRSLIQRVLDRLRMLVALKRAGNIKADVIAVSPDFARDRIAYLGTRYDGVYQSDDAGVSWNQLWTGKPICALAVSPAFAADRTLFAADRSEGIHKTTDGGRTWRLVNVAVAAEPQQPSTLLSFDPLRKDIFLAVSPDYEHDRTAFAGSARGLHKSTDGGETWQRADGPLGDRHAFIKALAVSPDYQHDGTIMVSVKGMGLFKSTDGGSTFLEIGPELIRSNFSVKAIVFSPSYASDRTVYAASLEELFETTDGGATWRVLDRPVRYEDGYFADRVRYEGQWKRRYAQDFSCSSVTWSREPGDRAVLEFEGTSVTWLGTTSGSQGMARVYLDGEHVADVDQYSEKREVLVSQFSISGLPRGLHSIAIGISDQRNI
ncbi:MAG: YCF48-related protein, partial [Anaerolineae bacterium]